MDRALYIFVTALGILLGRPLLRAELLAQTESPVHATSVVPRASTMTVGRLHYDGGGDWYANPSSLPNLLRAIRERTGLPVADTETVVTLTEDKLWSVPYLHMTGHGNVHFSDAELRTLRQWLQQGGFLHASDNYGMDESFRREIKRLFPDHDLVEVPLDHPIYHLVYDFPKGVPKIHVHDGKPAQGVPGARVPETRPDLMWALFGGDTLKRDLTASAEVLDALTPGFVASEYRPAPIAETCGLSNAQEAYRKVAARGAWRILLHPQE